jgi:hypothetical protein
VSAKPAFTPTQSSRGNTGFASARVVPQRDANVDEDGWGHDAPPVTRTQLEKVQPAYQPTKVNMRELTSQQQSSSNPMANRSSENTGPGPVRGAYQPIGRVDISAIRAQAKESGSTKDDRPEIVKGAYEPVGKVDIAAIRAKARSASHCSVDNHGRICNRRRGIQVSRRPLCSFYTTRETYVATEAQGFEQVWWRLNLYWNKGTNSWGLRA